MRSIFIITLVAVLGVATFGAGNAASPQNSEDPPRAALARIAGEGLVESHAFEYLTELSDEVGARLTGSPQSQKAVDWSLAKMRAIGLENVHAEKFQMWRGWTRGSAEAALTEPVPRKLNTDAMGWTGSTPAGGAEADVVTANVFNLGEEVKHPSRFAGKIVLMVATGQPNKDVMVIFSQFGDFVKLAGKSGAVAIFGGQGGFKSEGMKVRLELARSLFVDHIPCDNAYALLARVSDLRSFT